MTARTYTGWGRLVWVTSAAFVVFIAACFAADDGDPTETIASTRSEATTSTTRLPATTTAVPTISTAATTTTAAITTTTALTTSVPEAPPNPGDAVSCADFDTWEEAQEWYDTYAPHYGDIALIDINNNGIACEKLLPEGVTVEHVAATVTTAPSMSTAATAAPTTVTEAKQATRLEALFGLLADLRTAVENNAGYDRSDYDHDRRHLCNTPGVDPYTGLRFETSTCDVDHIVAAKEAHESGGHAWDRSTRRQFGNGRFEPCGVAGLCQPLQRQPRPR